MKILICYFSGTGNTKKVVTKAAEAFASLGHTADVINIEKGETPDFNSYDLLGIAYPVHAFNAPSIVQDFVKNIAASPVQKRAFVFKTSGEPVRMNNISSLKIKKLLKKRNYILTNEYHYIMPYNIIFRHSDAMAYKMWTTAQQLIPIDCKEICDGKKSMLGKVFMGGFLAWVLRIEHWGGRFNGKRYKVRENCIDCKKCVNSCPVGNITVKEDGTLAFGKNCLMCMRCSFYCPVDAIKIGMFEGWKVNGAYSFEYSEDDTGTNKEYCKKAYIRYFKEAEEKINGVQK